VGGFGVFASAYRLGTWPKNNAAHTEDIETRELSRNREINLCKMESANSAK
jgi:hypothetical protein